jgi:4-hydroxyphenylacetate 3-monooxygenase
MQYEMFYSGANMVTRGHAFRTWDWEKSVGMVDNLMAGYGLPDAADAKKVG